MRGRRLFALLYLLLALLPLRGWSAVVMHLPGAPAAATAPCHAGEARADGDVATPCVLCDLCHGAALPGAAGADTGAGAPSQRVRAGPLPPLAPGEPDPVFRPPRG